MAKSNQEKMKDIICRYIDGETYASIGKSYGGVSRQRIEQVVKNFAASILTNGRKRYTLRGAPERTPYERMNLGNWMSENRYTVSKLAEEMGLTVNAIYSFLNGKTCLRSPSLVKLSQITGLSIEDLIAKTEQEA